MAVALACGTPGGTQHFGTSPLNHPKPGIIAEFNSQRQSSREDVIMKGELEGMRRILYSMCHSLGRLFQNPQRASQYCSRPAVAYTTQLRKTGCRV